jgi:hypothetical protein
MPSSLHVVRRSSENVENASAQTTERDREVTLGSFWYPMASSCGLLAAANVR